MHITGLWATALASPEMRSVLVFAAEANRRACGAIGLSMALPPAFAGLMGLTTVFGRVDGRVSLGGLFGGLQLALVGAAYLFVVLSVNELTVLPS